MEVTFNKWKWLFHKWKWLFHKWKCLFRVSRLKDGIPVAPTDNVQLDTQGTLYSLSIATVTQEDAGTYECVARNKAGDDTCSAVLTVDGTSWSKSLKYCKAKFLYNAVSSLQDSSKHYFTLDFLVDLFNQTPFHLLWKACLGLTPIWCPLWT